ncbi:hypothetical protein AB6813_04580 [bacterium RCC_150]
MELFGVAVVLAENRRIWLAGGQPGSSVVSGAWLEFGELGVGLVDGFGC